MTHLIDEILRLERIIGWAEDKLIAIGDIEALSAEALNHLPKALAFVRRLKYFIGVNMDHPVIGEAFQDAFLEIELLLQPKNSVELLMDHFDNRSAYMMSNDLRRPVCGTVVNYMHFDAVSLQLCKHKS
jgi:hypothetical protein